MMNKNAGERNRNVTAAGSAGSGGGSVLSICGLTKAYEDQPVLEGVSLDFQKDRVYCLMGPSGCGKTTLLRILAGLEQPDAGTIGRFADQRIGMVFQEDRLFAGLSAVRNLQIAGIRRPDYLLAEILPQECLNQPVEELSGGMRRRTAVARAVGAESDILLMDEPFTGLDQTTRGRVIDFILRHRRGRLLIVTTHDPEDVIQLGAEQISLLKKG